MTDEEQVVEGTVGNEDSTINPEIEKALESGWKPQDEWDGEGEWIDYKEFNFRGELYDRIKSQTSKIRGQDQKIETLQKALQELGEHNHKIAQMEYEKALRDLRSQRRQAMEEGDFDSVDKIEENLEELRDLKPTPPEPVQQQSQQVEIPEVSIWREKNEWYQRDPVMRGAADAVALEYVRRNPDAKTDPERVLNHVTSEIKRKFPSEFRRTTAPRAVAEGGATRSSSTKSKYTERDLNDDQKRMARTFVEAGALKSIQEYVDQLVEIGEIGG